MSKNMLTKKEWATPQTFGDALKFSEMIANSSLCPQAYRGKPDEVMVAMSFGAEVGLGPNQSLQNIAVINGKPSIYGDALLGLVRASGELEDFQEFFEGEFGKDDYTAVCVSHRVGMKSPIVSKFSIADAKRMKKWGSKGPWTDYPNRMLQMRARGFNLRDNFPDVLKGLITAEEAQDYPSSERSVTADYTASQNDLKEVQDKLSKLSKEVDKNVVEKYRKKVKTYWRNLDKLTEVLSELESEIAKEEAVVVEAEVVQEPQENSYFDAQVEKATKAMAGEVVDSEDGKGELGLF
jgi:hypothetical protein